MKARALFYAGMIVFCLLSSGCRAPTAPDAGFIQDPQILRNDSKLPFDAVWFKEGANLSQYSKVFVAPIDTTHLLKLDWWEKANFAAGTEQSQADSLGSYFRDEVIKAFKKQASKGYVVVDAPDTATIRVELALVEVVPTKVWLNALGYVVAGQLSSGTTAFEGRLRDAKTNGVIAEFKDREYGQLDAVSVADLTWFSHSKHTLRAWSDDLARVCYRTPNEAISPISTVTLRPW